MPTAPTVRIAQSIAEIDAAQWDACANPVRPTDRLAVGADGAIVEAPRQGERFNPFVTHAFLHALETSKSVGGRTGWMPTHVLVENKAGRLMAAAPCYIKTHSMGEYVFDHARGARRCDPQSAAMCRSTQHRTPPPAIVIRDQPRINPMGETYSIRAIWDPEAEVYFSETDVPGLVVEAASLVEFIAVAEELLPELLKANAGQDVLPGSHIVSGTFGIAV